MKTADLSGKGLDELWVLHEQIVDILFSKMQEEKGRLEKRLNELRLQAAAPLIEQARRPYPRVLPKFRNPIRPAETWAGRGKQPRWLRAQLKNGRRLDEFRIPA